MQHSIVDVVDSTNDEARRRLRAGAAGPFCVVAREQTAGRGTHGRRWVSPRDAGLYLSYARATPADADPRIVTPPISVAFTLAAGLACLQALGETGVPLHLKPVNDLYILGRKAGGILTEGLVVGDRLAAVIIGVGVNVLDVPLELPPDAPPATCLARHLAADELARAFPERLPARLAACIHNSVQALLAGGDAEVRAAYAAHQSQSA